MKNRSSIDTLEAIVLASRRTAEEVLPFRAVASKWAANRTKNRSGIDTLGHCFRALV